MVCLALSESYSFTADVESHTEFCSVYWGPAMVSSCFPMVSCYLLRASSKIDKEDEPLLPFATWHQCSGKLRPEVEEQTKKGAKEAKAKAKAE